MKKIGTFRSALYGEVTMLQGNYGGPKGPIAVLLEASGEPLATLSVNMYKPECSADSRDLPTDCFYCKNWSENSEIAEEAFNSDKFVIRHDLPKARSGFVTAMAWQIK